MCTNKWVGWSGGFVEGGVREELRKYSNSELKTLLKVNISLFFSIMLIIIFLKNFLQ